MKLSAKSSALAAVLTVTSTLWGCAAPMVEDDMSNRQHQGGKGQKQDRRGPPPEAFEACATLSENDSCSVTTPRGELNGMCVIAKGQEQGLVCQPEGMEKPRQ